GYQIQVLPKIDFGTNPDSGNEETKRVFIRMLRSMKDFPSKVFNDANLKIDRMTLYDIFINMYLQNVRTLIKHAIKSAYVVREGNLNFFKGKLVVSEQIKRNIAHGERFYVRYDEYLVDRAENRLVKATLLKLQEMTSSSENQKEIRQLLTAFEMVEASTNIQEDFVHVVIDRNTKDYDVLMQWSKVFLLNKSFTTFSGDQNAVALLFPMEKVFESYVTQQLKKTLLDLNWNVSSQDKGYYLFDSPQQFALRPDIVITRNDGSKIILDTKWKSLVDDQRVNYGILQSDMYQMYAYSKKYEAPEVWLLYPLNEEMRDHPEISLGSRDGVSVRLFFVDVANIEENLSKLRSLLIAQ
ncbi:MAG: McrC family protein, partial [Synergistaceae bacterium]|nr:McrC family protein [Synergistaceae bacterium]